MVVLVVLWRYVDWGLVQGGLSVCDATVLFCNYYVTVKKLHRLPWCLGAFVKIAKSDY
jgi:hypothetical protein